MRIASARGIRTLALGAAVVASLALPAGARAPSVAAVDAASRSAGNNRVQAIAIGRAVFATTWAMQVTKIHVDRVGAHAVAGLLLSAVKFHHPIDRAGFDAEIVALTREAFAASTIEEVDLQAVQPLKVGEHVVVTGDYALPTTRVVFAATVRRSEFARFGERLRVARDVYFADDFRRRLETPGDSGR